MTIKLGRMRIISIIKLSIVNVIMFSRKYTIYFHFVKSLFSEMPCINRTAEVYLTFRRSELFIIFAFVLRSAGSC